MVRSASWRPRSSAGVCWRCCGTRSLTASRWRSTSTSPEEYPERKRLYIRASLIVETAGQKAILIGAGGAMLKRIGETARLELEELTGHPVYLDLWVKVSPHWRQSEPVLRRLGL